MKLIRAFFIRLYGSFHKSRHERDLALEMESHLEFHIEDNLRAGMNPVQARREALIKLGGMASALETCRGRHGFPSGYWHGGYDR